MEAPDATVKDGAYRDRVGVVSENTTMWWKWHPVIFSTCYFLRSTFSARAVLTTLSARAVFDDTFSTNSCHFSARSHLIGPPDCIFSTIKPFHWKRFSALTPLIGGQFCDFQHGAFSLVGINCKRTTIMTGCIQQRQWYFTYSKGNTV